jgi:hypothetical protein
VRGECGIAHRTQSAAEQCCDRDHRVCKHTGGYSDRVPVRVDHSDGTCIACGSPLTIESTGRDDVQWIKVCTRLGWTRGHGEIDRLE